MKSRKTLFNSVRLSLVDIAGGDYVEAVCAARSWLSGEDVRALKTLASQKVDFYPAALQQRLVKWLAQVGAPCTRPLKTSAKGATSDAFKASSTTTRAPLAGFGFLRLGEDGRLYLTSKSEHYHVSVGHGFPGYALVEHARRLGIPNATHNNTRGHITRLLEEELVRTAAGIAPGGGVSLNRLLASKDATGLNRVLNLATGSLAAEAAIKMVLARFYRPQADSPEPVHAGRVPVIVAVGDDAGGPQANYHGTSVLAQAMRGMWPELLTALEKAGTLVVRCVPPNDAAALDALFDQYNTGRYKVAAFFHELIMMNYGGKRLTDAFVAHAYRLCSRCDVPAVADEIQTCLWSPELFLFREYGVKPAVVVLGKGFSGGEHAASRILFNGALDCLPQFGALVTNGQEELASLAFLITMRWAEANADVTRAVGDYYQDRLNNLAEKFPKVVSAIEGKRHLAGIYFHDIQTAQQFTQQLNEMGLDISVHTYKAGCPPSALTKLPLTAGFEVVDAVVVRMKNALTRI